MKRRSFLEIISRAATIALASRAKLHVEPPPIEPVRAPLRMSFCGFDFIEDANPLRFILTPEGFKRAEDYQRYTLGYFGELNEDWVTVEEKDGFRSGYFRSQGLRFGGESSRKCYDPTLDFIESINPSEVINQAALDDVRDALQLAIKSAKPFTP